MMLKIKLLLILAYMRDMAIFTLRLMIVESIFICQKSILMAILDLITKILALAFWLDMMSI